MDWVHSDSSHFVLQKYMRFPNNIFILVVVVVVYEASCETKQKSEMLKIIYICTLSSQSSNLLLP